jgi:predicted esterase
MLERFYSVLRLFCESFGTDFMQALQSILRFHLLAVIAFSASATTLQAGEFISHIHKGDSGTSKYSVYLPDGFSRDQSWPVLLWLHGAGERGDDGTLQTSFGLGKILKNRESPFPFVVVFPQSQDRHAPILSGWDVQTADGGTALKILDEAIQEYGLDSGRQVLSGWSMGGFGAIELATHSPERWKSVVVLAGGPPKTNFDNAKSIPFWLFHGEDDAIVPTEQTDQLANRLREAGAQVRVTILPETDHNLWRDVYRWNGLWDWMLLPDSEVTYQTPPELSDDSPLLNTSEDFVAALEIPNVGYVRLGNRMLEAISASIPESIPADVLEGSLSNIWDQTQAAGRSFSVRFSRISYEGNVARAFIGAYEKDRFTLQLALSDVNLVIGRTDVSGSGKSAVAGPIRIVIGHREPVWLSVAVEPTVENRQLRFKLISTRFQIPRNNWYVTTPRILGTRGFGMTPKRVRESLVSGLYSSRRRIEEQVQSLVPQLIEQLENNLDALQTTDQLSSAWPLPVYQPQLRMWPQEVVTDPNGATIVMGMSVGAYFPNELSTTPRLSQTGQLARAELSDSSDLVVGVSSDVLTPLTSQLIAEDVAHIHLEDVPDQPFTSLYDTQKLTEIFSALKSAPAGWKVRHEFILDTPLIIETPPLRAPRSNDQFTQTDDGVLLNLSVPTARVITTLQETAGAPWKPFAEFELAISQGVQIDVKQLSFSKRAADIGWNDNAVITCQLKSDVSGGSTDFKIFEQAFANGWTSWIQNQKSRNLDIPDITFGKSKLRLQDAAWGFRQVYVQFSPPGIKILNQSEKSLNYQIKTLGTDWSETYELPAGQSHLFDGAQDFQFREIAEQTGTAAEAMTLPAGSESVYKKAMQAEQPQLFLAE